MLWYRYKDQGAAEVVKRHLEAGGAQEREEGYHVCPVHARVNATAGCAGVARRLHHRVRWVRLPEAGV